MTNAKTQGARTNDKTGKARTVYRLSSCVCFAYDMKNCEPFVFGPLLAMELLRTVVSWLNLAHRRYLERGNQTNSHHSPFAVPKRSAKLVWKGATPHALSTFSLPGGVAALHDEALDVAVKTRAIVVLAGREREKVL